METITASQVADVLDGASDEIMLSGWQQGMLEHPETGALCMLGGVAKTLNLRDSLGMLSYPEFDPLGRRAAEALRCSGYVQVPIAAPDMVPAVSVWNDDVDRTEDEVHEALRRTAKMVREGEILKSLPR
jgi:hypothetical protein